MTLLRALRPLALALLCCALCAAAVAEESDKKKDKDKAPAQPSISLDGMRQILEPGKTVQIIETDGVIVVQGAVQSRETKLRLERLKEVFGNILDMTSLAFETEDYVAERRQRWAKELETALNVGYDPSRALILAQSLDVRMIQGRIVVTGEVNHPDDIVTVTELVQLYDPDAVVRLRLRKQMIEVDAIFAKVSGAKISEWGTEGLQGAKITIPNYDVTWNNGGVANALNGAYRGGTFSAASATGAFHSYAGRDSLSGDPIHDVLSLYFDDSDIDARIIVRPHLSALNGEEAIFHAGGQKPYTFSVGDVVKTDFKDYGTKLTVRPMLTTSGKIDITVSLEFLIPLPDGSFTKFSHSGNAVLNRGEAVVLSGMMSHLRTIDLRKTPILGDIPILGFFFSKEEKDKESDEMVVIIQPRLPAGSPCAPFYTSDQGGLLARDVATDLEQDLPPVPGIPPLCAPSTNGNWSPSSSASGN